MSTHISLQNILQQLLGSAQHLVNKRVGSNSSSKSALTGFAGSALSGGALAVLLGNKKFRNGWTACCIWGVAALGALAYRSYEEWKNKEQIEASGTAAKTSVVQQPSTLQLERQSQLVVAAMISAAKADGHINVQE